MRSLAARIVSVSNLLAVLIAFAGVSPSAGAQEQLSDLDYLAMEVEAIRLQSQIGLVQIQGGFAAFVMQVVKQVVDNGQGSVRDFEVSLRKVNAGVHLFAVDKKFVQKYQGQDLCVVSLDGSNKPAQHYLWVSGQGPQVAAQHAAEFEIVDLEANLKNLETVGAQTICQKI